MRMQVEAEHENASLWVANLLSTNLFCFQGEVMAWEKCKWENLLMVENHASVQSCYWPRTTFNICTSHLVRLPWPPASDPCRKNTGEITQMEAIYVAYNGKLEKCQTCPLSLDCLILSERRKWYRFQGKYDNCFFSSRFSRRGSERFKVLFIFPCTRSHISSAKIIA